MPRPTRSFRYLCLATFSGAVLAAGCGGDQPAAAPPADTGKMEPTTGKMDKMEPNPGKMEPSTGKMDPK